MSCCQRRSVGPVVSTGSTASRTRRRVKEPAAEEQIMRVSRMTATAFAISITVAALAAQQGAAGGGQRGGGQRGGGGGQQAAAPMRLRAQSFIDGRLHPP